MFDTEKFILLIEGHPCLWDKAAKEYCDRLIRERAWRDVGHHIIENADTLTEEELKKEIEELKNKWRHIRDAFLRSLQTKSGSAAQDKKKKYVYADCLNFIFTSVEKRSTSGNIDFDEELPSDSSPEGSAPASMTHSSPEGSAPLPVSTSTTREPALSPSTSVTLPKKTKSTPKKSPSENLRKRGITPFQTALLQKLEKGDGKAKSVSEEDDQDKMFLLSMLADYKKLSNEDKLDFKLEMLQFFKRRRRTSSNSDSVLQPMNCNALPFHSSVQPFEQFSIPSTNFCCQSNFPLYQFPTTASSGCSTALSNLSPVANTSTGSNSSSTVYENTPINSPEIDVSLP